MGGGARGGGRGKREAQGKGRYAGSGRKIKRRGEGGSLPARNRERLTVAWKLALGPRRVLPWPGCRRSRGGSRGRVGVRDIETCLSESKLTE